MPTPGTRYPLPKSLSSSLWTKTHNAVKGIQSTTKTYGKRAGQLHSQVSQVVQSLEWVVAHDFFRAIKSLGLSQGWEHYKPVSWTNISWGVVIMFHPEVQLNTMLVLCLPDHSVAPQMAEQQGSFVLELQSCSDTELPVLAKLWESHSKSLWAKVLWFRFWKIYW